MIEANNQDPSALGKRRGVHSGGQKRKGKTVLSPKINMFQT
jgi:hypothetical protein